MSATHAAGTRIGYIRVPTVAQTLDQQQAALEAAGVKKFFSDTPLRCRDDRPGLAELMAYVRDGDTVWCGSSTGWACNLAHILATVKELTDRASPWCRSPTASTLPAAGRMMIGVPGRWPSTSVS